MKHFLYSLTVFSYCILLLYAAIVPAGAVGLVNVAVSPGEVDRYELFIVTVTTAYPNTTFSMSFSGPGYVLDRNGTTNAIGIWEERLSAALDFGTYNVFVAAMNETAQATLVVGCSARCVVDVQNTWGRYVSDLVANGIFQVIVVLAVIVLIVEGPKTAHYFWKNGSQAIKRGQLTAGDILKSPLAVFHGFVQPGRLSMKQDVNDRIATDLQRRALLEELHDATQARFMEYDPDHMAALGEIFRDLQGSYDREGRMTTRPPPVTNHFERTVKDMATEIEIAQTESWLDEQRKDDVKTASRPDLQNVIEAHYRNAARRRIRLSIALFVAVGIPAGLMALLAPLSCMGIYFEPVRPLWNPMFGDLGKFLIGIAGFLVTLVLVVRTIARGHDRRA